MITFIVSQEESEQTLISFFKKRFKTTPLKLIYKLFRTKKIKINGEEVRYYHWRLKTGEKIEIHDNHLKPSNYLITQPLFKVKNCLKVEVIYEDKNILIAFKEHGVTMITLDNSVRSYLFNKDMNEYKRQAQRFFILTSVHRLDKLTQGLVIYPKNPVAKRELYKAIGDKNKITKKYLAFCEANFQKSLPNYVSGYLYKNDLAKKMEFYPELNSSKIPAKFCSLEIKRVEKRNLY
jgi:23S rRNA pseudouridine955/2504/2580 synthase